MNANGEVFGGLADANNMYPDPKLMKFKFWLG